MPFFLYLQNTEKNYIKTVEKKHIEKLIQEIFPTISLNLYPHDNSDTENNSELLIRHLFFLCILSNRLEMAKIFWKIGKVSKIRLS